MNLALCYDMVVCMKTTVEIPNNLLNEAKRIAQQERTTVRALVEEGLRWVLRKRSVPHEFHLEDASVSGEGVQPGVTEGNWEHVGDLIYRGRGT